MKNVTISDLAKKLKLSASTVSRALNDHPDINETTRSEIKKLAKKLNYIPNPIARSLKSNKTNVIGVIVPEIKHDFFSYAISGVEEVAYNSGYTIILSQSNENYEREVINTKALVQQRVAGLIVSISQNTRNGDHFKAVINQKIPLVFFDRALKDINTNKVIIDDAKSSYNAVMHLIKRGRKRIAHISGSCQLEICQQRMKGYKAALKKSRIPIRKELIICGEGLDENTGYNSMDYLLKSKTKVDAVFSANDPIAIGAFQRIKEEGLRIPEDIAIVGFSNNKITRLVEPTMTTINQPSFEMGKKAAELLMEMIRNRNNSVKNKTVVLDAGLVVRNST